MSLYKKVEAHLKKNPEMDYDALQKKARIKISRALFYSYKSRFKAHIKKDKPAKKAGPKSKRLRNKLRSLIADFLHSNPHGTRKQFVASLGAKASRYPLSPSNFAFYKKQIMNEKGVVQDVPKEVSTFDLPIVENGNGAVKSYTPIIEFPSNVLTTLTKHKIRELIKVLNEKKNLNLEVVEYTEPKRSLEIREVS